MSAASRDTEVLADVTWTLLDGAPLSGRTLVLCKNKDIGQRVGIAILPVGISPVVLGSTWNAYDVLTEGASGDTAAASSLSNVWACAEKSLMVAGAGVLLRESVWP